MKQKYQNKLKLCKGNLSNLGLWDMTATYVRTYVHRPLN